MDTSTEQIIAEVEVPSAIKIAKKDNSLTATGKIGSVTRDFSKLPAVVTIEGSKVVIKPYGSRKKDRAIANTARSIVESMIKGAEKGYTYRLKIIFAHFPISVKVKGKEVHVENFFGERSARKSKIVGELTKVTVAGEDLLVQGPNLEDVSQTAANIEQSTRVKDKDQRVFLDGLYVYAREDGQQ